MFTRNYRADTRQGVSVEYLRNLINRRLQRFPGA